MWVWNKTFPLSKIAALGQSQTAEYYGCFEIYIVITEARAQLLSGIT